MFNENRGKIAFYYSVLWIAVLLIGEMIILFSGFIDSSQILKAFVLWLAMNIVSICLGFAVISWIKVQVL